MYKLDSFDEAIVKVLRSEGRISVTDLADKIGLSRTPTQIRLKNLEDRRLIKGYRAIVDPQQIGLAHVAFVEVSLTDTRERALSEFNDAVNKTAEIEECHLMASNFDYLLKIRTRDMSDYRRVLAEVVSGLPHLRQTSTFVVMETIRETV